MSDDIEHYKDDIEHYKHCLRKAQDVICQQVKLINDIRAEQNCQNYRHDTFQQYNRRKSIRLQGTGSLEEKDDAEAIIKDIAETIEKASAEEAAKNPKVSKVDINLDVNAKAEVNVDVAKPANVIALQELKPITQSSL